MASSRVDKYKELREGLKEEAGIPKDVDLSNEEVEEDEFLSFVNKNVASNTVTSVEDTITDPKTFEQLRQESSEEIDKALRSAKSNVGKEEQYNTRMDILNKIRNPEKEVIKIDKMENLDTEQFAKGYFIKSEEEDSEEVVEPEKEVKKRMTLMERLASMSPKEDVENAKKVLEEEPEEEVEEVVEQIIEEEEESDTPQSMIDTNTSLEEMLSSIKEKDRKEVEKAQKTAPIAVKEIKEEVIEEDIEDEESEDKIVTILNYVIFGLIIVFIVLCGLIAYQIFF